MESIMREQNRTPAIKKAKEFAKILRKEKPNYFYLKDVFKYLRIELGIKIEKKGKKLPYVPSDEELKKFYKAVWEAKNFQDMLIIKTLLYTGCRVSEIVNIKIENVDFDACQIKIQEGKGKKDRIVPFPTQFKEVLKGHIQKMELESATYLFESSWHKKYTPRGIQKMFKRYVSEAEISESLTPHKIRHYLFRWLKSQGVDDALIQPYSGHVTRQSLEIYSRLSLNDAQVVYDEKMKKFLV